MAHLQQVGIQAQNIEITKTMNQVKLQNKKITCKHAKITPWNVRSSKVI
jgi:Cu/Ag efflux protein CusF